jgi:hypothetical protein
LYDSWANYAQITFTGYNRSETLTNFPALVILGADTISGFDYSQFLSGSNADLRFTDNAGLVDLNYEIEEWNTSGDSYVWVQVPAIAAASAAIVAHWGMSGQSAPAATTNGAVWDSDFKAVWHLNGTNDATSNRVNLIRYGSVPDTGGKADGAKLFDGNAGDYLYSSQFPGGLSSMTLEAWIYPTNGGTIYSEQGQTTLDGGWYDAQMTITSAGEVLAAYWPHGGATPLSLGTVSMNAWHHVVMTYRSGDNWVVGYVDGVQKSSGTGTSKLTAGNLYYTLGAPCGTSMGGDGSAFDGAIDESRVSFSSRGSNWVWACYMNMASNTAFQTYGAMQASNPELPTIFNAGASNILTDSADLIGNLLATGASPTTVMCYWGTNDGGTVATAWMSNTDMGIQAQGYITNTLTGLTPSQTYYFRYYATNSAGERWASSSAFTTLGPPSVDNGNGATNIRRTTAQLQGTVRSGNPAPSVWIYWGATDGGTTPGAWDHQVPLGSESIGAFSANVMGLSPVQQYWYRCFASNSYDTVWAASSAGFVTAGPAGNGTFTFAGIGNWSDPSKWDAMPIDGDSVVINGNCTNDVAIPNLVNLTVNASQKLVVPWGTGNTTNRYADDEILLSGSLVVNGTLTSMGDPTPLAKSGTATVASGDTNVVGSGTLFSSEFAAGDGIGLGGATGIVQVVVDNTHLILTGAHPSGASGVTPYLASGRGMTLAAANVNVPAGGSINADLQGFPANAGPGAGYGTGNYDGSAAGGGYGGRGGNKIAYQANGGPRYGSSTAPTALGSGGGSYNGTGGTGGGAIQVLATGTCTIDGRISSDGGPGSDPAAGGAGGSVWIVANTFAGGGLVRAAGGNTGQYHSGGGGGRRVCVAVASMTYTGTFSTAAGVTGSQAGPGEPGSLQIPDNYGLTVTSDIGFEPGTYHIPNLVVTSNATLECFCNPGATTGVTIVTGKATVDGGARIIANAVGYPRNQGPGHGTGVGDMGGNGGGGGYGGAGGSGFDSPGGITNGSLTMPVSPGSGGGAYGTQQGGTGGGVIKINAVGDITINGTVSADGDAGWDGGVGGGAGGSVWLLCHRLYGSGTNSAAGGPGAGSSGGGGGGGGGRIALWVQNNGYRFAGTNAVLGGAGGNYAGVAGSMGTVYTNMAPAPGFVFLFQ